MKAGYYVHKVKGQKRLERDGVIIGISLCLVALTMPYESATTLFWPGFAVLSLTAVNQVLRNRASFSSNPSDKDE